MSKLQKILSLTIIALVYLSGVGIHPVRLSNQDWLAGDRAEAATGGRARGGSFGSSSSQSGSSSPSRSNRSRSSTPPSHSTSSPSTVSSTSTPTGNSELSWLPIFITVGYFVFSFGTTIVIGFIVVLCFTKVIKHLTVNAQIAGSNPNQQTNNLINLLITSSSTPSHSTANQEIANDIVTVTMLQVALRAGDHSLQAQLTQLVLNTDTKSSDGLRSLLQESSLALLRMSDQWTHAYITSETFKAREDATKRFDQRSIEERSKFDVETLAIAKTQQQCLNPQLADSTNPYTVVTFLIGSADDAPLANNSIYSHDFLQTIILNLSTIAPDYLLVFELLWCPQNTTDQLTEDDLLTKYPKLLSIT